MLAGASRTSASAVGQGSSSACTRQPAGRRASRRRPRATGSDEATTRRSAAASPAEGTDLWAVARNLVSLTPLRLDLTDHEALEAVGPAAPSSAARAGPSR